jgi:Family of unknown function (DUF5681)
MSKPIDKSGRPPANDNVDYAVGNCRPPIAHQFKPGIGGNKKGRPKGSKNFSTLLNEELAEIVVVHENGKRVRMPKRRALAKQLVNGALGNNPRASRLVLDEIRGNEGAGEAAVVIAFDGREDKLVMGSILRRICMTDALPTDADKAEDGQDKP